jgi:hypothetical protein
MTTPKLRALHRQIGLAASLWLVIAAFTTLIINHRDLLLPKGGQSQGPYGQFLLSHANCASQPERLLLGTANGVFLSLDGGKSFREVSLPVPSQQVVGVAFHPNEPDHFYAVLRSQGIFSSTDGGQLWTRINFPSASPIHSFQIGFDGSLSVLTPEGLHRRVQEHWTLIPRPSQKGVSPQESSRGLLRLAYNLHDGQFYGKLGVWVTDLVALSLLALVGSGFALWRRLSASS